MVSISCSVYAAPYASSAHTSISPKRWPPNCALPPSGCWVTSEYGPAVLPVRLRRSLAVLGEDAVGRRPAEVRLEHLADVHPARHAERVQDDVDRPAVRQERHVLFGDDARDDALVAVASRELVALGD